MLIINRLPLLDAAFDAAHAALKQHLAANTASPVLLGYLGGDAGCKGLHEGLAAWPAFASAGGLEKLKNAGDAEGDDTAFLIRLAKASVAAVRAR
mmetsp:Transcript_52530/g.167046  ORF Transcript_52530/g.167046 Transcript_52530/m.167046 type:complete len:95 (-) Transcript_52530:113-397(-)